MVDFFASNLTKIKKIKIKKKKKSQHLFVSLVNPLNKVSGTFNEFELYVAHSR